ncbi:GLUG motif-containing protein, partial [Pseudomonas paraeruginosa]
TAVALNRVVGTNGSQILGKLDANGKVFLVNPNGVVFGKTAQVNVGGLVASTLDISDKDFLDGNYRFSGKSTAQVSNAGSLNASEGGSVALLGARVDNSGVIQARLGSVALGAGEDVSLNFDGNGLLNLQVNAGAVDALAHNGGLLKADGGQVLMTARSADSLLKTVVSNQGVIEAKTLQNRDGRIVLDAGNGTLQVAGRQDASASGQGNGGVVENRGAGIEVQLGAKVDTQSAQGRTGTWKVAANALDVASTSAPKVSGVLSDTLANNLQTTNIELTSTQGDIKVDAPLSWNSGNKLGLSAERGNVEVNGNLRASGDKAELALNARDHVRLNADLSLTGRNARLELNSGKGHKLADGVRVTLSGAGAGYRANGEDYRVIQNLAQLREIDEKMGGRYVLGNRIDGGNTRFETLGNRPNEVFGGDFDGLGNSIANLVLYSTTNTVGLFNMNFGRIANLSLEGMTVSATHPSNIAAGTLAAVNLGTIDNVKVRNSKISSGKQHNSVGGLVARNLGSIHNSSFQGRITGNHNTDVMGGLVGYNGSNALIANSSADAVLDGQMLKASAGALAGINAGGTLRDSRARGSINLSGDRLNIGGLIGHNQGGTLHNLDSAVDVTARGSESMVGGLVGYNQGGQLSALSVTGNVTGGSASKIGGLIGESQDALIVGAQAQGKVTGGEQSTVGGLIGRHASGRVEHASASGDVTTGLDGVAAGLIGWNIGDVSDTSATGNVSSDHGTVIAGLVGWNLGSVSHSFTSGRVDTSATVSGKLIGLNRGLQFDNHVGEQAPW